MSGPVLIRAAKLSKRFSRQVKVSLWHTLQDIAHQLGASIPSRDLRSDEFWALRDVSFEIAKGEAIAVIGNNGAGKSTLIKLLMGRMLPTSGTVETHGTINALTVLGLGFDPILSGRENVLLNAATMGLSRRQTLAAMDAILDFAELDDFAEAPVQSYSSGMRARLGYAVAAHVNPDILLLDEVLAVGDVGFRRKCRRHLKNYIAAGGTMILVTHDMHAVQTMCTRCLVLDHGRLLFDGPTTDGIHAYLDNQIAQDEDSDALEAGEKVNGKAAPAVTVAETSAPSEPVEIPAAPEPTAVAAPLVDTAEVEPPAEATAESPVAPKDETPDGMSKLRIVPELSHRMPLVIHDLEIRPVLGAHLRTGEPAEFRIRYEAIADVPEIVWGFTVSTADGLINIASMFEGLSERIYSARPGRHTLSMRVERLPLLPGRYALKGGIGERQTGAPLNDIGWEDAPVLFSVRSDPSPENNVHAAIGDLVTFEVSIDTTST